jgi:hypothetical protein
MRDDALPLLRAVSGRRRGCGGTFDDPNWFERGPETCRHIFTRSAQQGVVLPAGLETYLEHAIQFDGTPSKPIVLDHPRLVTREE